MSQQTTKNPIHRRLIILGSGPAGYTAAIYAARSNLAPTIITGSNLGGQLVKTVALDNWPGEIKSISGYSLMERMQQHATRLGVETIFESITKVTLTQKPFLLESEASFYSCDALIIATGTSPKFLGLSSEQEYLSKGLSTCATCDGYFYKGKTVAVIGGGSTALEDALYLADLAKEVIIIHRRDKVFTAEPTLTKKVFDLAQQGKIKIMWQHIVEDIIGDKNKVTGIKVKNVATEERSQVPLEGVFVAVGLKPNTDLFIDQLELVDGFIKVHGSIHQSNNEYFTATSIDGVFAAGDVANPFYRQAIAAAGMGCMAALDVKRWL